MVSIAKLMMTTKRNNFSLPYATDMASTFYVYYLDCTTHTTQPVAHVVYEHTRLGHRDIGLKPKLSSIPIVYDYYDAKF